MSVARVIDVVEAAYSLDGTEQAWLTNLAESTAPALDRGLGIIGYIGETATMRAVSIATVNLSESVMQMLGQLARSSNGAGMSLPSFQATPFGCRCLSEGLFSDGLRPYWEASGFVDGFGVYAHVAEGKSVHLFAGSPTGERMDRRTKRVWERVAAHMAAGHRVRAGLAKVAAPEAVLDSS